MEEGARGTGGGRGPSRGPAGGGARVVRVHPLGPPPSGPTSRALGRAGAGLQPARAPPSGPFVPLSPEPALPTRAGHRRREPQV